MAEIKFAQQSPRGNATIDTACLLIAPAGTVWLCSGAPAAHALTPASDEQLTALAAHFGADWRDALAGMKGLGDG